MRYLFALTFFAASTAFADVYIGGNLGKSEFDYDTARLGAAMTASGDTHTGVTSDSTGTGFKALIGYRISRNVAAELALVDLGKFKARTTRTPPPTALPGTVGTNVDSTIKVKNGFSLSGLGILPLGDFSVFGRVGFHNLATIAGVAGVNIDGRSTALLYGVGLGYDVTKRLGVRVEWERFTKVGDESTIGERDADLISAGLVFRF